MYNVSAAVVPSGDSDPRALSKRIRGVGLNVIKIAFARRQYIIYTLYDFSIFIVVVIIIIVVDMVTSCCDVRDRT